MYLDETLSKCSELMLHAADCASRSNSLLSVHSQCLAVQASTGGSSILIDALVTNLLAAYNTPLSTVRAIALRGLSYIADLPPEQVSRSGKKYTISFTQYCVELGRFIVRPTKRTV